MQKSTACYSRNLAYTGGGTSLGSGSEAQASILSLAVNKPGPCFEKLGPAFSLRSNLGLEIKTGHKKLSITYDKKLGTFKMMPEFNNFAAIAFLGELVKIYQVAHSSPILFC